MLCVGIDPGINGAIAEIDTDSGRITATKMPETTKDICSFLKHYKYIPIFIMMEEQHARPAYRTGTRMDEDGSPYKTLIPMQGSVAAWTFAQHYGELRGILTMADIPFNEIKPKEWMKALGIRPKSKGETQTQWKNFLKGKAQQIFPTTRVTLAVADALLLAHLCHRLYGNTKKPDPFSDI